MAHLNSALVFGVLAALCLTVGGQGVTYVWTGNANTSNWETVGNWNPTTGIPSQPTDTAIINMTGASVSWGANNTSSGNNGTVGTLILDNGVALSVGPFNADGQLFYYTALNTIIQGNASQAILQLAEYAVWVGNTVTLTGTAQYSNMGGAFNTTGTLQFNIADDALLSIVGGESWASIVLNMTGGQFQCGADSNLNGVSGTIAGFDNYLDGCTISSGNIQIQPNVTLLVQGGSTLANVTITAPQGSIWFSSNSTGNNQGNNNLYDSASISAQTIVIDGSASNAVQCGASKPGAPCVAKLSGVTLSILSTPGTNTGGNQVQIAVCLNVNQTVVDQTYFGSVAFNPGATTGPLIGNFSLDIGTSTGLSCDSVANQTFTLTGYSGSITSQAPLVVGPNCSLSLLNLEQAYNNTYSVSFESPYTTVNFLKWLDIQSTAVFIPPSQVVMTAGSMPGPENSTMTIPPATIHHIAHYASAILKVSPQASVPGIESVFVNTASVDLRRMRSVIPRHPAQVKEIDPLGWTAVTITPNCAGCTTTFNSTHDDDQEPTMPTTPQWVFFTYCQPSCLQTTCQNTINEIAVWSNQSEWRASTANPTQARPCMTIIEPGDITVHVDNVGSYAAMTIATDIKNQNNVILNLGNGPIVGDLLFYNVTLFAPQSINISGSLLVVNSILQNDTTYNVVATGVSVTVQNVSMASGASTFFFETDAQYINNGTCFEIWDQVKGESKPAAVVCNQTVSVVYADYPHGFQLIFGQPPSPSPPSGTPSPPKKPNHGAIIGGIIGAVVALAVVAVVGFFIIRRRRAGYTGVGEKGTNL